MRSKPPIPISVPESHELPKIALDGVSPRHLGPFMLSELYSIRQVRIRVRSQIHNRINVVSQRIIAYIEQTSRIRPRENAKQKILRLFSAMRATDEDELVCVERHCHAVCNRGYHVRRARRGNRLIDCPRV